MSRANPSTLKEPKGRPMGLRGEGLAEVATELTILVTMPLQISDTTVSSIVQQHSATQPKQSWAAQAGENFAPEPVLLSTRLDDPGIALVLFNTMGIWQSARELVSGSCL